MHYKILIFLIPIIYVPCSIVAKESKNHSALQHLEDVPLNELNSKAKILGYWVMPRKWGLPLNQDNTAPVQGLPTVSHVASHTLKWDLF